jgi:hypothetical protein
MQSTNPYLKNRKNITLETREEPLTKQSFQDECDIHNIIKQYDKTGLVTHINETKPHYIDHTQVPSREDMLNHSTHIQQQFDQLPINIKKRFHNNMEEYAQHLQQQLEDASASQQGKEADSSNSAEKSQNNPN